MKQIKQRMIAILLVLFQFVSFVSPASFAVAAGETVYSVGYNNINNQALNNSEEMGIINNVNNQGGNLYYQNNVYDNDSLNNNQDDERKTCSFCSSGSVSLHYV